MKTDCLRRTEFDNTLDDDGWIRSRRDELQSAIAQLSDETIQPMKFSFNILDSVFGYSPDQIIHQDMSDIEKKNTIRRTEGAIIIIDAFLKKNLTLKRRVVHRNWLQKLLIKWFKL